ncbi:MAG: polysaccharide deacetylase family protein [Paludibacter sp.]
MNLQFPRILRPFFGKNVLWRKKTSSKVIYLTFDDGPVPDVTPSVLAILDQHNWKATFFCVGENVSKYPDIYNEILHRGHKTGNHTHNHLKGFSSSSMNYLLNVQKAANYIDSNLFRPPHGQISAKQIKLLKNDFQLVMWDVITHDYNKKLTPEQVLSNITKNVRSGSIVVFHDSVKAADNMLTVLPLALNFWTSKGYTYGLL